MKRYIGKKTAILLLSLLLLTLATLSLRAYVRIMEPRYLFHPSPALVMNPSMVNMKYRDVTFFSGPWKINGWYLPGNPIRRYIIYFHDTYGNMADSLSFIKFMSQFGFNFLIIDYRGYGKSEGYPTIEGLVEDGVAAVKWAEDNVGATPDRIILWGHGVGGGVAAQVLLRVPRASGLVLDSSFISLRRLSMDVFPYLPVVFVSDVFDNLNIVKNVSNPKLFIHGKKDPMVPFRHTIDMYEEAADPKQAIGVKGGGHSDAYIVGGEEYYDMIYRWINNPS